ncbi:MULTISPECIES: hypothetical protein [unclassified Paenarthrobacter]|uniref:LeuD/DmdB family oxidoreductase small subunit n=1 Tax=unclassified Paenarthrobacter TaxID=2634190 RepID=UPI001F37C99B|nr:hypothetical protein [Paenarthrobacter sp. AR 02]MCF3139952.1 hypothetical protein [Paenarthrobacter sp. AR 02]
MTEIRGKARFVRGQISTDDIIPARYKHMYTDPADMAPHVFENRFPELASSFEEGDVLIGTDVFGIGSSREQAVSSLMALGIRAIVSPRFGRIFFRNCWNLGIPAIEVDTSRFIEGRPVRLDLTGGYAIIDENQGISFPPPPQRMIRILENGGLLNTVLNEAAHSRNGI